VQIAITARHGSLNSDQQGHLQAKAEKLQKYFGRLMSIEVEADHNKNGWLVEVFVSAEHKHDFVAREEAPTPEAAMDLCIHKVEQQLRRYKEKVQDHRDAVPHGGTSPSRPDLPEPPAAE
jgi:putative sigma-54 modulation protein